MRLGDGRRLRFRTRRSKLTVHRVGRRVRGTVTVRGVLAAGRPRQARDRPPAAPMTDRRRGPAQGPRPSPRASLPARCRSSFERLARAAVRAHGRGSRRPARPDPPRLLSHAVDARAASTRTAGNAAVSNLLPVSSSITTTVSLGPRGPRRRQPRGELGRVLQRLLPPRVRARRARRPARRARRSPPPASPARPAGRRARRPVRLRPPLDPAAPARATASRAPTARNR